MSLCCSFERTKLLTGLSMDKTSVIFAYRYRIFDHESTPQYYTSHVNVHMTNTIARNNLLVNT
jgi:hypothetical protein